MASAFLEEAVDDKRAFDGMFKVYTSMRLPTEGPVTKGKWQAISRKVTRPQFFLARSDAYGTKGPGSVLYIVFKPTGARQLKEPSGEGVCLIHLD